MPHFWNRRRYRLAPVTHYFVSSEFKIIKFFLEIHFLGKLVSMYLLQNLTFI